MTGFRERLTELERAIRAGGVRPIPNGPGSLRHIQDLEVRAAALEQSMAEAIEDISEAVERLEAVVFPKAKKFRDARMKRLGSAVKAYAPGPQVAPPVTSQTGLLPSLQGVMRVAPPAVSMPVPMPPPPGPAQPTMQFPPPTPVQAPAMQAPSSMIFPPGVPPEVIAMATGKALTAEQREAIAAAEAAPKIPPGQVESMVGGKPIAGVGVLPVVAQQSQTVQPQAEPAESMQGGVPVPRGAASMAREAYRLKLEQEAQQAAEETPSLVEGAEPVVLETTAEPSPNQAENQPETTG